MGLTLLTALYGDHDALHPLPDGHGFDDAVLVTDQDIEVHGWRTVRVPGTGNDRLDAKAPKLAPWRYVDAERTAWIDASAEILDGSLHAWLSGHPACDLRAWPHPEQRACLYEEAAYCQDWPKYAAQPIRQQVQAYRDHGMPGQYGLWACGTLLWQHTVKAQAFGERWLAEQHQWSIQDQISLPYLLWSTDVHFEPLHGHQYLNPYLRWHWHRRSS